MRVDICPTYHKDAGYYVRQNVSCGYEVFEDKKKRMFYIQILNEGNTWRAEDAQFLEMPSVMYIFKE